MIRGVCEIEPQQSPLRFELLHFGRMRVGGLWWLVDIIVFDSIACGFFVLFFSACATRLSLGAGRGIMK